jgi:general secretion pathway protein M
VIRAWLDGLQPRERKVLLLGGAATVLMLGWALLWYPLAHARGDLAARVARQRDDLAWMRQASAQAGELRKQGTRSGADRQGKSLLALADVTARNAGLAGALKRVEPAGGNSVRVNLEIASFDMLADWLDQLAREYGVQVTDFSADKVEGLGLVNARVTLQDGQH